MNGEAIGTVIRGAAARALRGEMGILHDGRTQTVGQIGAGICIFDRQQQCMVLLDWAALAAIAWQEAKEDAARPLPTVEAGMPVCPNCGTAAGGA